MHRPSDESFKSFSDHHKKDEEDEFSDDLDGDILGIGKQGAAKKFRLLIIGKSGCGKTTILSKVYRAHLS